MIIECKNPGGVGLYQSFLQGKTISSIHQYSHQKGEEEKKRDIPGVIFYFTDGTHMKLEYCQSGLAEDFGDGRGPQTLLDLRFLGVVEYAVIDQTEAEAAGTKEVNVTISGTQMGLAVERQQEGIYAIKMLFPGEDPLFLGCVCHNRRIDFDGPWYVAHEQADQDYSIIGAGKIMKGQEKCFGYANLADAAQHLATMKETEIRQRLAGRAKGD